MPTISSNELVNYRRPRGHAPKGINGPKLWNTDVGKWYDSFPPTKEIKKMKARRDKKTHVCNIGLYSDSSQSSETCTTAAHEALREKINFLREQFGMKDCPIHEVMSKGNEMLGLNCMILTEFVDIAHSILK